MVEPLSEVLRDNDSTVRRAGAHGRRDNSAMTALQQRLLPSLGDRIRPYAVRLPGAGQLGDLSVPYRFCWWEALRDDNPR